MVDTPAGEIVTRGEKQSALTNEELDNNFLRIANHAFSNVFNLNDLIDAFASESNDEIAFDDAQQKDFSLAVTDDGNDQITSTTQTVNITVPASLQEGDNTKPLASILQTEDVIARLGIQTFPNTDGFSPILDVTFDGQTQQVALSGYTELTFFLNANSAINGENIVFTLTGKDDSVRIELYDFNIHRVGKGYNRIVEIVNAEIDKRNFPTRDWVQTLVNGVVRDIPSIDGLATEDEVNAVDAKAVENRQDITHIENDLETQANRIDALYERDSGDRDIVTETVPARNDITFDNPQYITIPDPITHYGNGGWNDGDMFVSYTQSHDDTTETEFVHEPNGIRATESRVFVLNRAQFRADNTPYWVSNEVPIVALGHSNISNVQIHLTVQIVQTNTENHVYATNDLVFNMPSGSTGDVTVDTGISYTTHLSGFLGSQTRLEYGGSSIRIHADSQGFLIEAVHATSENAGIELIIKNVYWKWTQSHDDTTEQLVVNPKNRRWAINDGFYSFSHDHMSMVRDTSYVGDGNRYIVRPDSRLTDAVLTSPGGQYDISEGFVIQGDTVDTTATGLAIVKSDGTEKSVVFGDGLDVDVSGNVQTVSVDVNEVPDNGSADQVLTKTSGGYAWADGGSGTDMTPTYAVFKGVGTDDNLSFDPIDALTDITQNNLCYLIQSAGIGGANGDNFVMRTGTSGSYEYTYTAPQEAQIITIIADTIDTDDDQANLGQYIYRTGSGWLGLSLFGDNNTASGRQAVAMGSFNTASGTSSVAMGQNNIASRFYAVAMGQSNTASGDNAVAMGRNNTADTAYSVALGQNSNTRSDDVMAVGYGTSSSNWEGLRVKRNGDLEITGVLRQNQASGASETPTPTRPTRNKAGSATLSTEATQVILTEGYNGIQFRFKQVGKNTLRELIVWRDELAEATGADDTDNLKEIYKHSESGFAIYAWLQQREDSEVYDIYLTASADLEASWVREYL